MVQTVLAAKEMTSVEKSREVKTVARMLQVRQEARVLIPARTLSTNCSNFGNRSRMVDKNIRTKKDSFFVNGAKIWQMSTDSYDVNCTLCAKKGIFTLSNRKRDIKIPFVRSFSGRHKQQLALGPRTV